MTPRRRLARLVGLLCLWQTMNLLERMVYAAGVEDGRATGWQVGVDVDDQGDALPVDDLEAADVSDVVLVHIRTFHGPDAPRAGECAC